MRLCRRARSLAAAPVNAYIPHVRPPRLAPAKAGATAPMASAVGFGVRFKYSNGRVVIHSTMVTHGAKPDISIVS